MASRPPRRCFCVKLCGGPDGPGVKRPYSTYNYHQKRQREANAASHLREPSIPFSEYLNTIAGSSTQASCNSPFAVPDPSHAGNIGEFSDNSDGLMNMDAHPGDNNGSAERECSRETNFESGYDNCNDVHISDYEEDTVIPDADSLTYLEQEEQDHLNDSAFESHLRDSDELPLNEPPALTPPNFVPQIEDVRISLKFIELMQDAKLVSDIEPISDDLIHQILHPPEETLTLNDPDDRLSLDIYLALTNASQESYNRVREGIIRRYPDSKILTYYQVKKLVEQLSGVSPIMRDMCINSCIGYTGPFTSLTHCPHCGEARYESKHGVNSARKNFTTIPISTQLQALRRTKESSASFAYRREYTERILKELRDNNGSRISSYTDFFDGSDYLAAVLDGRISWDDFVLMLSIDGAQLYRNKVSDCWIYIWVILDHDPSVRYKVRYVLPGGFIPGPNKPKNTDSFLFPGLYHVAAVQRQGGMGVWDARQNRTFLSNLFLALASADTPAMACLNGFVGHQGRMHCRWYCPLPGRLKDRHYYPARFKPHNYTVSGSDHEDVDINSILVNFTSTTASERYNENLRYLITSPNKTQYSVRRLETGIVKPSIFSGLAPRHILGLPAIFAGDCMHLPALNIPDLYIALWRGTMDCDKSDNKDTWDWAIFRNTSVWKAHGKDVAAATPYMPGSFDRPPRDIAEKISSGYKAWEFLLYFYGLGPCLLFGHLPRAYWMQYCKLVKGILLLLGSELSPADIVEANTYLTQASDEFEILYVQRKAERLHFVRPSTHAVSHLPHEALRIGPPIIYSQWTMERTIGNLGEEIHLHSSPYANLAQCGIRRCQLNALKAMIPDLEESGKTIPRGAIDIGDGYLLLRARDTVARPVNNLEAEAFRVYLEDQGLDVAEDYIPRIVRWARVRLPNGQIARARWREELKNLEHLRMARNVKLQIHNETCLAEIHFYVHFTYKHIERFVAVGSFYGRPNEQLFQESSGVYVTVQHFRDIDVRVVDIKFISSVVMLAPDVHYPEFFQDGSEDNQFYLAQKPGLNMEWRLGIYENDEHNEGASEE